MKTANIRNFCLVAHIDHGKSTLADRIMEICGAVEKGHPEQLLDSLELEREHGITIKLKAIRLVYSSSFIVHREYEKANEPLTINHSPVQNYILNLIDTPGHVDFTYEVSRSLASVEGAVLIVDATQGVQAQTLANFKLSLDANLTIIPVINKIDSPQANIGKTIEEIKALGFSEDEIIKVSAKTGENVEEVIETIIKKVPSPRTRPGLGSSLSVSKKAWPLAEGLQALIFDSSLDPYKGVIATIRLFGGEIKIGNQILLLATKTRAEVLQIGYLTPKPTQVEKISDGEVGYIITNIKNLSCVKVGDTVTTVENPANSLPGYQEAKPVVFLSFYPTDPHDHEKLKTGLEREYDLDIIVTSPSVNFEVDGEIINKAQQFNPQARSLKEPIAIVTIFAPKKYMGVISNLIYDKRGEQKHIENIGNALKIEAEIPLIELLIGFYDQLKSATSGFASFDFEIGEYRESKLVKLDILVNHEQVEGLSQVVHKDKSETFGRKLVEKLKDIIPRQQIAIPLQAAIGGKIIARETIPAFRKDVTQKLYGGDVTRKKKLLEKQKKGKKRMRRFGNIDIPQEAF